MRKLLHGPLPGRRGPVCPGREVCAGSPAKEPTAACFIDVLGDTDTATLAVSDPGGMLGAPWMSMAMSLSGMSPVLAACTDMRGSSLTVWLASSYMQVLGES